MPFTAGFSVAFSANETFAASAKVTFLPVLLRSETILVLYRSRIFLSMPAQEKGAETEVTPKS